MPRFDPAEFGRLLARLTPQELRQAEGLVTDARERAEAVLEIDARTEMELLGVRGDLVGPQRDPAGPGAPPRPRGRAGA